MDRITIHQMVPETPEFWRAEVQRYLKMSRPQQLVYWRQKRASRFAEDDFDEYGVWVRYLGAELDVTDYQSLVPREILDEERARK